LTEQGYGKFYEEDREVFNIGRIIRYTRPALTKDQDAFFDGAGTYIEVFPGRDENVLRQVPECLEFVLNADILVEWGVDIAVEWVFEQNKAVEVEITSPSEIISSSYTQDEIVDVEIVDESEPSASSYLGEFVDNVVSWVTFDSLEVYFAEDPAPELTESIAVVPQACECELVPIVVEMSHNLEDTNVLGDFIHRNNFVLPRVLTMIYSTVNRSWQANLHYSGWGSENNITEVWDIVFEWSCVNEIASVALGDEVWKFSMYVKRKKEYGEDFDTRVLLAFVPLEVCPPGLNLVFSFALNTETNEIFDTGSSSNVNIRLNVNFDNIGLFKSPEWLENPELEIQISQEGIPSQVPRLDISQTIPKDVVFP
jgi:hypothetical protein